MKDLKGMCAKCPKYETCDTLCDACEKYVSQDYVSRDDGLHYGDIENKGEECKEFWGDINIADSDKLKRTIIRLYLDNKNEYEIAYHLSCSQQYIHKIIKRYKNKITTNSQTTLLKSL